MPCDDIGDIFNRLKPRLKKLLERWPLSSEERKKKEADIQKWLYNFEQSDEIEDMVLLLEKLDVISTHDIKTMLEDLAEDLKETFRGDFSKVLFYPLGSSPSSSGGNFLYDLRQALGIDESCFLYHHPTEADLTGIEALIFIDDIIGSGSQAVRFARRKLSHIKVNKYFLSLFALEDGLERVKRSGLFTEVIPARLLSEEWKAFSPQSRYFSREEKEVKERIRKICFKYGQRLYPEHPLGFKDSQSLLVFLHNVPNNTLPVIWSGTESEEKSAEVDWNPVWNRRKKYFESKAEVKPSWEVKAALPMGKVKVWGVPELPSRYLERPAELAGLKTAVLAEAKKPLVIMGISRRFGVQGMGGVGKSVLTAALAMDAEIQQAFPNGILWLTIGQQPQILVRQSELAGTLGDSQCNFRDENEGRARLSSLLADKACLLILDDVWKKEHTEAFGTLRPKCQMLITTRDAGLIKRGLEAEIYHLDELNNERARKLLAAYAGKDVRELPASAGDIIQECGNLPLALAMIEFKYDKPCREALDQVISKGYADKYRGKAKDVIMVGVGFFRERRIIEYCVKDAYKSPGK